MMCMCSYGRDLKIIKISHCLLADVFGEFWESLKDSRMGVTNHEFGSMSSGRGRDSLGLHSLPLHGMLE
jgi:hypothetical protein